MNSALSRNCKLCWQLWKQVQRSLHTYRACDRLQSLTEHFNISSEEFDITMGSFNGAIWDPNERGSYYTTSKLTEMKGVRMLAVVCKTKFRRESMALQKTRQQF